ncbi:MAG: HigA family addiction module antitoxin [Planctomycetota bacterium]
MPKKLPPIHPGEILLEEFLAPLGISRVRLARDTSMPPSRVGKIIAGERGISAETALRLGRYFGNTAQFWMNLQSRYDLRVAEHALHKTLDKEVAIHKAAG